MPIPVVYIDVVWLVNFLMDAAILWTTCWIMKRSTRPRRLLLAALVGSLYALLMFVPHLQLFTTWAGKALASLWIVGLGVPWRNWLDLGRAVAMYYLVTFVFAGAAIALHFALPGVSVASGVEVATHRLVFTTSVKSLSLILGVVLGAGILRYGVGRMRRMQMQKATRVAVRASIGEREVTFTGLVDTGNQLRDPISRKPVCLVESQVLANLLPDALSSLQSPKADMLDALSGITDEAWMRRISIVPYRGAGGTQQLTFAVRPDTVLIQGESGWYPAATEVELAAHEGALSLDDQFQAIMHIEAIVRDDSIETHDTHRHQTQDTVAAALDRNTSATGRGQ
ncbi:sigma-E processing peptidase SpoIIGA [Alicyclobacillus sp. ALC3]|uniref:sigma-E processing peptidase SpoIIGA n=1 Tax=Alicyclobacillus sp. ALC3 TaxID=2796143 RepID=UPI002379873B|nr:sigma-E processing peptidase SpoIIGA [Alicyclobacillus sp. ALC3]WDL97438.1 sigma-E processing peptidase SpoIIGA [Alicyclobacillus sp. ALC3]